MRLANSRVLLVEDSPADTLLIRELLKDETVHLDLLSAGRLEAGLELLDSQDFDLVLLDLRLPDSQGLQTLTTVRARAPEVPIIVLTGLADGQLARVALRQGAQDYLVKGELSGRLLSRSMLYAIERRRAQEALRESEIRLQAQYKGIPVPTYTWQRQLDDFVLVNYNDAADDVARGGMSQFLGIRLREHYRDHPQVVADMDRVFSKRSTIRREMVYRYNTSGRVRDLLASYVFVPPDLVLIHTQDVTEQKRARETLQQSHDELERRVKERTAELMAANQELQREVDTRQRAEQALRESEALYRALVETSPDAITVTDHRGNLVKANEKTLELHGYSSLDQLVGRSAFELIAPEDRQLAGENMRLTAEKGSHGPMEYDLLRQDGSRFPAELSAAVIPNAEGQPASFMAITRSISQRKRIESELRTYAGRLEVLLGIDRGILAAQSPQEIGDVALEQLRRLIPCQRASVTLFDLKRREMLVLAAHANGSTQLGPGVTLPLTATRPVLSRLARGEVTEMSQRVAAPRFPGDVTDQLLEEMHPGQPPALMAVPLRYRGELIGSLNLACTGGEPLTPVYEDIARQVADQLAIAIQQARLHEEVRRRAEEMESRVEDRTRELSTLYEVAAVAAESLDLDTALTGSLKQVLEAVGCAAGTIHLLDAGDERLELAVERGLPAGVARLLRQAPGAGSPLTWVLDHGGPLVTLDLSSDPRLEGLVEVEPLACVALPMRARGRVAGILSVFRADQPPFSDEEVSLLGAIADQVGLVAESTRLHQLAKRAAVLTERQRLARDLHDSVTQSLYSLTLLAETGRRAAVTAGHQDLQGTLERLGAVGQQALKEMRLMIYELRPPELEQEGLVGALQQRLDTVEHRAGVEARLRVENELPLTPEQEEGLYRLALEALNNALKHAAASHVEVRIRDGREGPLMQVSDDGLGYDQDRMRRGMGLLTMRERAERLGGVLQIESSPGKGTRVTVSLHETSNETETGESG